MFIDTHCHLSTDDYEDIDSVVAEDLAAGVKKIIVSGCTRESIEESINYADQYEDVYVTIGFHPSEALIVNEEDFQFLECQLSHSKVVGVGEIGLDYHYGKEDLEEQKNLFRRQLRLADQYHLPVVIHSRDAVADTIAILKEYPNVKGDIHCFSGSLETARIYLSMGYYLGIGGVVTFKNSHLSEVVQEIGVDAILLETDSPYLTPDPYRGLKNSSKYIPVIADKIAEILKLSIDEVARITTENAVCLFDLK